MRIKEQETRLTLQELYDDNDGGVGGDDDNDDEIGCSKCRPGLRLVIPFLTSLNKEKKRKSIKKETIGHRCIYY